jgi:sulfonate transport system substrate-binding protein
MRTQQIQTIGHVSRFRFFSLLLIGILMMCLALTGCGQQTQSSSQESAATPSSQNVTLRIGYQKFGTLNILKARGTLEKRLEPLGVKVTWTEFPGGPQLLEAMNVGSIDFGHTGEAPPVFAQAAGTQLVYIANDKPNPAGEGILVPKDSKVHSVADLKGKKVALNKGSNVHYLLVQALAANGLKYSDIQPVYLAPGDARAAFERGSVDAWVIWDPYYAAAQTATGGHILLDGKNLVANREFMLSSRTFAQQHPDIIKIILDELNKTDEYVKTHQKEVAQLLSPQIGIDVQSLELSLERRDYGITPITDDVLKDQQKIADTFYQLKLIPNQIQVKDAVVNTK